MTMKWNERKGNNIIAGLSETELCSYRSHIHNIPLYTTHISWYKLTIINHVYHNNAQLCLGRAEGLGGPKKQPGVKLHRDQKAREPIRWNQ